MKLTAVWFVVLVLGLASPGAAQSEAPNTLPLLPVTDGVLFPSVREEIQIIAPEHIQLIEEAENGDHLFGLVTLQPGALPDAQNHRAIFPVGMLCLLERVARPGDGRLYIMVRGIARIRILQELDGRPYRVGRVETYRETVAREDRAALRTLREQVDQLTKAVESVVLEPLSDAERINALSFYTDLDLFERQSLLDTDGVMARARRLIELLTMKLGSRR